MAKEETVVPYWHKHADLRDSANAKLITLSDDVWKQVFNKAVDVLVDEAGLTREEAEVVSVTRNHRLDGTN